MTIRFALPGGRNPKNKRTAAANEARRKKPSVSAGTNDLSPSDDAPLGGPMLECTPLDAMQIDSPSHGRPTLFLATRPCPPPCPPCTRAARSLAHASHIHNKLRRQAPLAWVCAYGAPLSELVLDFRSRVRCVPGDVCVSCSVPSTAFERLVTVQEKALLNAAKSG